MPTPPTEQQLAEAIAAAKKPAAARVEDARSRAAQARTPEEISALPPAAHALPSVAHVDSVEYRRTLMRLAARAQRRDPLPTSLRAAQKRMQSATATEEAITQHHARFDLPTLSQFGAVYPTRPPGWYPVPDKITSAVREKLPKGAAPTGIDPAKLTPKQREIVLDMLKQQMGPEEFRKFQMRLKRDTEDPSIEVVNG